MGGRLKDGCGCGIMWGCEFLFRKAGEFVLSGGDSHSSRFLSYLRRMEECAAAGYADMVLFPSLVLPDVFGTYLRMKGVITCDGKPGSKYKACLRRLLVFDAERYGVARICREFGVFMDDDMSLNGVCEAVYSLRCCLAHGGNIRMWENPDVTYFLNTEPMDVCRFIGLNSVYPMNSGVLYHPDGLGPGCYRRGAVVNIGRLVCAMCGVVGEFYYEGDAVLKRYLDDFNRTVVFERGAVADAVVSGNAGERRGCIV